MVETIEDADYSPRDLRRPGIPLGGEARPALTLHARLLEADGKGTSEHWALVALDVAVDTSAPSWEAMANMLATFAQFERRLISQRTKEALAVNRAHGVRLGRLPTLSEAVVRRIQGGELVATRCGGSRTT